MRASALLLFLLPVTLSALPAFAATESRVRLLQSGASLSTERTEADWISRARAALGWPAGAAATSLDLDTRVHDVGRGPVIVTFRPLLEGLPVFRAETDVLLTREGRAVAVSTSSITAAVDTLRARGAAVLSPGDALQAALSNLGAPTPGDRLVEQRVGRGHTRFTAGDANAALSLSYAVAQQGWLLHDREALPVFRLTIVLGAENGRTQAWSVYVDARDGRVMRKHDLVRHEAFSYRVFASETAPFRPLDGPKGDAMNPHPSGTPDDTLDPPYIEPVLVTLANAGIETGDYWLAGDATTTEGNHAKVRLDVAGVDGPDEAADRAAPVSAPLAFDYAFDGALGPQAANNQNAAMTHAFYVVNTLHDIFYNHGFNEGAGNAQDDNFGRADGEPDAMRVDVQDRSGSNNANMLTPPDGIPPRMQLYLWDPRTEPTVGYVTPVVEPLDGFVSPALFGPQTFDLAAPVIPAEDEGGPASGDGCEPLVNDVIDSIALVARGNCNYVDKVRNVQAAGGVGVLIQNYFDDSMRIVAPGGDDALDIVIPVLGIEQGEGEEMRARLAQGEAVVSMIREGEFRDAALDTMVIAHEWTHYLTNRLIGNGDGLTNQQGMSMGEGWSDFVALLMTASESDLSLPGNDRLQATYAMSPYLSDPYFGIRRAPYTTDFSKNPLTFRYIENGVPLPEGYDFQDFGWIPPNASAHRSGEIWALALWEVFVALVNDDRWSLDAAKSRMLDYLVAGLKLTPVDPTFLEARDAMLAVALATDTEDHRLMWQAFARRGMGMGAIAPPWHETQHHGVVESFVDDGAVIEVTAVEIREGDSAGLQVCDADGVVDQHESGHLFLKLRNTGTQASQDVTLTLTDSGAIEWSQTVIDIPDVAAGDEIEVAVPFTLHDGRAVGEAVTATYAFDAPASVVLPAAGSKFFEVNFDFEPAYFDDLEVITAAEATWTAPADVLGSPHEWRVEDVDTLETVYPDADFATGRAWYGPDPDSTGAQRALGVAELVSPPIEVPNDAQLIFGFDHAFRFEAYTDPDSGITTYFDFGVVYVRDTASDSYGENIAEIIGIRVDGRDYNVSLNGDYPNVFGGEMNPGYFERTTITLPPSYAGKTVEFRFHIFFDEAVGDFGWLIDNVSVENAVAPPFLRAVENATDCGPELTVDAGSDRTLPERAAVDSPQATVTLQGSVQGGNEEAVVSWRQVGGPQVQLGAADTLAPQFVAPVLAENVSLVFRLEVTDGERQASDEVSVNILNVNGVPRIEELPEVHVLERIDGTPAVVNPVAIVFDEDGDTLDYSWRQLDGPAASMTSADSRTPSITVPDVTRDERLRFELEVSDGEQVARSNLDVMVEAVMESSEPEPEPQPEPQPEPEPEPSEEGGGGALFWAALALGLVPARRFASTAPARRGGNRPRWMAVSAEPMQLR